MDFNDLRKNNYDCIVICVAHTEFINIDVESMSKSRKSLIYDLKGLYNNKQYMRL